jgi:Fic family protein
MIANDDFEFFNSEIWLKYTQHQYRTLDEIKYRLNQVGYSLNEWDHLKEKIIKYRKAGAIPFFIKSLDKKFWFYPSDCIYERAHQIEKMGISLFEKIIKNTAFSNDFIFDATIEEAITSAIYEGANSTRAKAKELIALKLPPKSKDDWMLLNNLEALLWIKKNHTKEITPMLVKEIHAMVTKNTLADDDINFSGKFRNDKVFVYHGSDLKHEGIAHEKIEEALAEVISLTTKSSRYFPPLLKGILLHYFTAYIHPFFDGNGRTSRTLFYFKAIKNDLNFIEILSVSAFLKNHGRQYEKSFEKVIQNDFDLTYFIDFNLEALHAALEKVSIKVEFLISINSLKQQLNLSSSQIGLLQRMALHKFRKITIENYAETIGMSREVARQELKHLNKIGLLDETKESKKYIYKLKIEKLQKLLGS